MAAMEEGKINVVVKLKREHQKKDEPPKLYGKKLPMLGLKLHLFEIMCRCLLHNFSFFENAKIWVGRTTLNREKKGDGLTSTKPFLAAFCIDVLMPFARKLCLD